MTTHQLRDAFRYAADFLRELASTGALPLVTPSTCDVTGAPPCGWEPGRPADLVEAADLMDARRGGEAR